MPPPPPEAPRSAWSNVHTPASRNTTASAGNAYFSKACTKLWPMKPITISTATTSSREGRGRRPVSVLRERGAHAVHGEPAHTRHQGVHSGRQQIAP